MLGIVYIIVKRENFLHPVKFGINLYVGPYIGKIKMKYYLTERIIMILITTAIVLTALVCLYRITYDGFIKNTNKIINDYCQNDKNSQNYVIPSKNSQPV